MHHIAHEIYPVKVKNHNIRKTVQLILLSVLLVLVFFFALGAGEYELGMKGSLKIFFSKIMGQDLSTISGIAGEGINKTHSIIVWNLRFPRLMLAMLAGLALAVSGAVYQGCFRNPLVEPYLLGVSSGAAFGAALAIVIPSLFPQSQITAFIFALLAVFLSYSLARNKGQTPPMTLILSGIVVGSIFTAFVSIMKYIAQDAQLREITFWMMGGFHYASFKDVYINAIFTLPCFFIILLFGWKLNILSLGDEEARSLGVSPDRTRFILLILATLMAAVCVSTVGIIAWIGLMMPHAARMLFGADNRWLIPSAALLGAIYMLVCDTLARTLISAEIPIAIITSILGAPYLLWLLRTKGRSMYAS